MSIYEQIAELEKNGKGFVVCTIMQTKGSTPRHEGSKMIVQPDGHFWGTVGGGEVENRVLQEAREAYREGKNRVLHYKMVDPNQGDPGICGGQLDIFLETHLANPHLLVVGGGHVGKSLAHLAKWLGYYVIISDDRPEFCTKETNPDADSFLACQMKDIPQNMEVDANTWIVLTTRSGELDIQGLTPLLATEAPYIGVIGSRRRWAMTQKALHEAGTPDEKIDRVHSPIGLELNAETPDEIALSIMAEIIMLRNKGTGKSMKGDK